MTEKTDDRYSKYDDFEGPGRELKEAYQRFHQRTSAQGGAGTSAQGNFTRIVGTPRKAKHRGAKIGGVPIK